MTSRFQTAKNGFKPQRGRAFKKAPPFSGANGFVLLPAGSQNGLHLLRLLIDGLIPGEPALLTERGHGLNQLIDLRAEQCLAVPGLDGSCPVRGARVPILNRASVR